MRRRILMTTVAVAMITLGVFGVLVLWASTTRIVQTQADSARIDADRIATGVNARLAAGLPVTPDALAGFARSDESVEIRLPDGRSVLLGLPKDDQPVSATSTAPGATKVTVHMSGISYPNATFRITVLLGVLGLVSVGVAVLAARRLSDSLVGPVRDLALIAARLGSGDPRPARRRYGIEELDAVAEVLDVSAARIGEQIATERQLAADVSHQLRTPLTALSMRLEEVLATDDAEVARAEAVVALQQVERLSGVVNDLLAFGRHARGPQGEVEIDAVLAQQQDEWRASFEAQHRPLEVVGEQGLVGWVSASSVSQVVATLLENALVHGGGVTTMRARTSGSSVVIEVSDRGPGVPAALVRHIFDRDVSGASRSGLGLAVARALIEVEGGRLELIQAKPATFAVFLAVVPRDDEEFGTDALESDALESDVLESGGLETDPTGARVTTDDQGAGVSGSAASGTSSGTLGKTNIR